MFQVQSHYYAFDEDATVQVERKGDRYFTARLAFASSDLADRAYTWLLVWIKSLQGGHLTLGLARTTVKSSYTCLTNVISAILQTSEPTPDSDEPLLMRLGSWVDNCDAVTRWMIFLWSRELFGSTNGTSVWKTVLDYVGGEDLLKLIMSSTPLLQDLEDLCDLAFSVPTRSGGSRIVYVDLFLTVADHHALGFLGGLCCGNSRHRCGFSLADARYFGWVAYQCAVEATVAFLDRQFEGGMAFMEQRLHAYRQKLEAGTEQRAEEAQRKQDHDCVSRVWKKMSYRPLLANGRKKNLLATMVVPPIMHVLSAAIQTNLTLNLKHFLPLTKAREAFEAKLLSAQTMHKTGDFSASAFTYRQVINLFRADCEDSLAKYTSYSLAPRFLCLIIKIAYHPRGQCAGMRLGFRVLSMLFFLFQSAQSAYIGGREMKRGRASKMEDAVSGPVDAGASVEDHGLSEHSNNVEPDCKSNNPSSKTVTLHTDNSYHNSLVHVLPEVSETMSDGYPDGAGMSLLNCLEEHGERSFLPHQENSGILRSKTNLPGEKMLDQVCTTDLVFLCLHPSC